jgi:hypothetical protein
METREAASGRRAYGVSNVRGCQETAKVFRAAEENPEGDSDMRNEGRIPAPRQFKQLRTGN